MDWDEVTRTWMGLIPAKKAEGKMEKLREEGQRSTLKKGHVVRKVD